MSIIEQLKSRSGSQCELTGLTEDLLVYTLPPATSESTEHSILVNASVAAQLEGKEPLDVALYEGSLSGSMWSEIPAVQITVWRLLQRLKSETWASDLIDMLYLDEEMLAWAQSGGEVQEAGVSEIHKDANGVPLATGDSVVLTKSLDVKGSSLNARIGTVVKNIRLVPDNTDQIEGKIEGQLIVILTKYVKKHS